MRASQRRSICQIPSHLAIQMVGPYLTLNAGLATSFL